MQLLKRRIRYYWSEHGADALLILVWVAVEIAAVIKAHRVSVLLSGILFLALGIPALWYIGYKVKPLFQRRGEKPWPFPWRECLFNLFTTEGILLFLIVMFLHNGYPW